MSLRWADPKKSNHEPDLLDVPVDRLHLQGDKALFAMELVAIEHINEGDEVFLDYGDEWEKAWLKHVDNWVSDSNYVSANDLNTQQDSRLQTAFDCLVDPYPTNVILQCNEAFQFASWTQNLYHNKTSTERKEFIEGVRERVDGWFECDILSYNESDAMYRAVMYSVKKAKKGTGRTEVVEQVPREGFRFVDTPYTGDMVYHRAFRHDLRIPDHMLPLAWRNAVHS